MYISKNDIITYLKVRKELSEKCEKWAKENLPNWKTYECWELIDLDNIRIDYSYTEIENNIEYVTEFDCKLVPINSILKNIKMEE